MDGGSLTSLVYTSSINRWNICYRRRIYNFITVEIVNTNAQQKWSYDSDSYTEMSMTNTSSNISSTGDFYFTAEGDIYLDSKGEDLRLNSNGSKYLHFKKTDSQSCIVYPGSNSPDIIFGSQKFLELMVVLNLF